MITLRFTGGTGTAARAIQAFTWSWVSHVDIEVEGVGLLGACPDGGGVAIRPIPEQSTVRTERYAVEADAEAAIQAARSQIGKPYDWTAIFGFVCRRDWQRHDAWFCSELAAWACQQAGRPLLRAETLSRITPRDLLMSPFLKPLF